MTIENQHDGSSTTTKTVFNELGEAKHAARSVAATVKSALSDGANAVSEKARSTYVRAVKGVKSVADQPSKIGESVRDIVRENPLAAVATVAVVCLCIGRLLVRR